MYNHLFKIKIVLMILLPVFFVFLGFNNVSAIDDWSITVNVNSNLSSFPDSGTFCHNSGSSLSGHSCSDYNYLIFESNFSSIGCGQNYFLGFSAGGTNINFPGDSLKNIFEIKNYNRAGFYGVTFSNSSCLSNDSYYKFTLSESLPGSVPPTGSLTITENGTFDVSEVASVNVNVPQDVTEIIEDPVSNDFHKIFMTVVVGVIPAFAIFVIVWFAIDLMSSLFFGKGK